MGKPLSEIARQAWLDCPLDGDHWEATVQAVRSKVIEEAIEALKKAYAIGDPYPIPSSPWNKGRNELYERALNALTALKDKAELRSICHADTEQAEQSVSAVPASSNEDGEAR